MNLFILRHGIAEPDAPEIKTDAERPLIPKGEENPAATIEMKKGGLCN